MNSQPPLSPRPVRVAAYIVLIAAALLAIASIDGRAMQLQREYEAAHPPVPYVPK